MSIELFSLHGKARSPRSECSVVSRIGRNMFTISPSSLSALRSHVLSLYTLLKERTASLAILQATPKSVFSILLSWTFALPSDVEGPLIPCDLCRWEAGLSGFIQGHAQLQERSGCSKLQLTGWIRPWAGLRRAAVEHNQLLLDCLCVGCSPGSALRSRLLVVSLLAWCQRLSTETMGEYSTVWPQCPHALLHKHPTYLHCPHGGVVFTYTINIYQTHVSSHALYWEFSTQMMTSTLLTWWKC